jgi:hypothetical protein
LLPFPKCASVMVVVGIQVCGGGVSGECDFVYVGGCAELTDCVVQALCGKAPIGS